MNPLERSYRRLLRAYPQDWREEHGEELLAVLLECAPDHQTKPTAREAMDVICNGLRARLVAAFGWFPRELTERVGLQSLGSGAAVSVYCLLFGEYVVPELREHTLLSLGPIYSAGSLLYVLWLAATVLTVTGIARNLRRVAVTLMSAVTALAAVHLLSPGLVTMPPMYLLALFGGLAGFALLAPRAPTRVDRGTLGLVVVALGLGIGGMSAGNALSGGGGYLFYRGTVHNLADGSWLIVLAYWLTGGVASAFSRGWLRAAVVASLPWIYFSMVPTASRFPDLVIGLVGGAGLLALLLGAMRLDRQRDRNDPRPAT